MTDRGLLCEFCLTGKESTFTELVGRYLGMVRGVANRRTGNPELADEITQNVFTALARKAADLPPETNLAGWLHRAAVLESIHALRTEYTRREKMQQLATMTNDPAPIDWNEIRPELDGAIDELGARDREVVVLRFVQERTLAQIGDELGKTESAAQRHLQRALGKLSAILRKRGITATTTGLAFILGVELGKVASAGCVASEIAKNALAFKGGGATAAITATTFAMTKSTILITSGLLIAAALTTGSVLVGQHQAKVEREEALSDSPSPMQNSRTPQAGSGEAKDSLRKAKLPLHELMEKIRSLALSGDLQRTAEIELLLGQIDAEQMPEALDFLREMSVPGAKKLVALYLFKRWGELDGIAAAATHPAADPLTGFNAARGLAEGWSLQDPEAASEWYQSLDDSGIELRTRLEVLRMVFAGWLSLDPGTAVQRFQNLSFDEQKIAMKAFEKFGEDPEKVAQIAEVIPLIGDEPMRLDIVEKFGENWLHHDPSAAMAWFDSMEFENAGRSFKAATEIINPMMDSDPASALDWLWPKATDEQKEFGLRFVRKHWAKDDRTAAEAWLVKQGFQPAEILEK